MKVYNAYTGEPVDDDLIQEEKAYNAYTGEEVTLITPHANVESKGKKKDFFTAYPETLMNSVYKSLDSIDVFFNNRNNEQRRRNVKKGNTTYFGYEGFRQVEAKRDQADRKVKGLKARDTDYYEDKFGAFEKQAKTSYLKRYKEAITYDEFANKERKKNLIEYTKEIEKSQEGLDPITKGAVNLAASLTQIVPAMGLSALTASPFPMLAQASSMGFFTEYGDALENNVSEDKAVKLGALAGGLDLATSYLGMKNIFGLSGAKVIKMTAQALKGSAVEAGASFVGGAVKGTAQALCYDEAAHKLYLDGEEKQWQSVAARAGERGLQEGAADFLMGMSFKGLEIITHQIKTSNWMSNVVEYLAQKGIEAHDLDNVEPDKTMLEKFVASEKTLPTEENPIPDSFNMHETSPKGLESFDNSNLKTIETLRHFEEIQNRAKLEEPTQLNEDIAESSGVDEEFVSTSSIGHDLNEVANMIEPSKEVEGEVVEAPMTVKESVQRAESVGAAHGNDVAKLYKKLADFYKIDSVDTKVSTTINSLLKKFTPDEVYAFAKCLGADFTYKVRGYDDSTAAYFEKALEAAKAEGDDLSAKHLTEAISRIFSEHGYQLGMLGKWKRQWSDPNNLYDNVQQEVIKTNNEMSKKNQNLDKQIEVEKEKLKQTVKVLEDDTSETINSKLTQVKEELNKVDMTNMTDDEKAKTLGDVLKQGDTVKKSKIDKQIASLAVDLADALGVTVDKLTESQIQSITKKAHDIINDAEGKVKVQQELKQAEKELKNIKKEEVKVATKHAKLITSGDIDKVGLNKEQIKVNKEKARAEKRVNTAKANLKLFTENHHMAEKLVRSTIDKYISNLHANKTSIKASSKVNYGKSLADWVYKGEEDVSVACQEAIKDLLNLDLTKVSPALRDNIYAHVYDYLAEAKEYHAELATKRYEQEMQIKNRQDTDEELQNFYKKANYSSLAGKTILKATIEHVLPTKIKSIMKQANINVDKYMLGPYHFDIQKITNDTINAALPYFSETRMVDGVSKATREEVTAHFEKLQAEMIKQARGKVTRNFEKAVHSEFKQHVKGSVGFSDNAKKVLTNIDTPTFRHIFKTYFNGGSESLATIKQKAVKHFKDMNIFRDDEIQRIGNLLEELIHKNMKETAEAVKKPLLNKDKFIEPITDKDITDVEAEFFNAGSIFDDRTFKAMVEGRIPRAIKQMLSLRGINLKDYAFGSSIDKAALIEDLTSSFSDATKNIDSVTAKEVAEMIQNNINDSIKNFEVKKREQLNNIGIKSTRAFGKTFRRLIEYGGLSDYSIETFAEHMKGKLVLTEKDIALIKLKQEQMQGLDPHSEEYRAHLYDVKNMLQNKQLASRSIYKRSIKATTYFASANVLSGINTSVKNIYSNILRPTSLLIDLHLEGLSSKVFGLGDTDLRTAAIYRKVYFNAITTGFNILSSPEVRAAIKKTTGKTDGSLLDLVHSVAYNKKKFVTMAWQRLGHEATEGISSQSNPLGASLWGLDSAASNIGKLADIAAEIFSIPFDAMQLIDAPAKQLAYNSYIEAQLVKEFSGKGVEDPLELDDIVQEMSLKVKKYVEGSYRLLDPKNIPEEKMIKRIGDDAVQSANEMTFQQDVVDPDSKSVLANMYRAVTSDEGRLFGNLFVKTPINVTKFGIEQAVKPVAPWVGMAIRKFQGCEVNKAEMASALAKTISGAISYAGFISILSTCSLDATYEKGDKGKADEGLPIGYSLRTPFGKVNLSFVEPYGKVLLFIKEMANWQYYFSDEDKNILDKSMHFIFTVINDTVSGDMTQGWMDLSKLAQRTIEGSGGNEATKLAVKKGSMLLPFKSFFNSFNKLPEKRESIEELDALSQFIDEAQKVYQPGNASVKLSKWSGKIILNPQQTWVPGVTVDESTINNPVLSFVHYAQIPLPVIPNKVDGMKLSPKDYYDLIQFTGEQYDIEQLASQYMTDIDFWNLTLEEQKTEFNSLMRDIYGEVVDAWLSNRPDITEAVNAMVEAQYQQEDNAPAGVTNTSIEKTTTFNLFKN